MSSQGGNKGFNVSYHDSLGQKTVFEQNLNENSVRAPTVSNNRMAST